MRACFIDCTEEMGLLIHTGVLTVPNYVDIHHGDPSPDEIVRLCENVEVMMVEHTIVTPDLLARCPKLKAIIFMGTGAGTYVDIKAAEARGVRVLTTPGYGNVAVAEHAFALMMAGARRIAQMDRDVRDGHWQPLGGLQIRGSKVAVIGLGGIGQTFADMCTAVGMEVRGWNRSPIPHPAFCENLEESLKGADIVSLHLALTAETAGFLDRGRLALPKRGYMLVNTARAELVDEDAMLALLTSGHLGHVATDVFNCEPVATTDPLLKADNTTLTAHAAYMTEEAYVELWKRTLCQFRKIQMD